MGQKLYQHSVIKELQYAIQTNNVTITPYKDYSFIMTGIKSCGIHMTFYHDPKLDRLCKCTYMPENMNNAIYKEWENFALGKFLFKDIKNNVLDINDNTVYSKVVYTTSDGKEMKALIRKLIETTGDTLSDEERLQFLKQYCDIIIDDRYYAIIKISDNVRAGWCIDDKKSMVTIKPIDEFSMGNIYDTEDDNNTSDNDMYNGENEDPLF